MTVLQQTIAMLPVMTVCAIMCHYGIDKTHVVQIEKILITVKIFKKLKKVDRYCGILTIQKDAV